MGAAGIPIAFAVVTDSDGTDESLGEPGTTGVPEEERKTSSHAVEREAWVTDQAQATP
jgi:hypothetical protein